MIETLQSRYGFTVMPFTAAIPVTALFGSAVLALAVQRGWISGVQAFELSRLDEAWQEERWGVDAEAAERADRLRNEAEMLSRWFRGLES